MAKRPKPPPPGALRRERKALLEVREQKLRDLGGLLLEMYRQDRFREELVHERCAELIDLDARLDELDWLLEYARRRTPPMRCACGAPRGVAREYCLECGSRLGTRAASPLHWLWPALAALVVAAAGGAVAAA